MGDAAKISTRVPSTCVHIAIDSSLIIHIMPDHQICVAIDNPSLIPSVSCLTSSSYLWNYVRSADDDSHAGYMQSNCFQGFSHIYKFRDRIQVTQVLSYCRERKS